MKHSLLSICLLLLVGILALPAAADTVTVQLNVCNTSGSGGLCNAYPNPPGGVYATVTKTLVDNQGNPINSGTGNVQFQVVLTSPLLLINNGFGFNGPNGITSANISTLPSGYSFVDLTSVPPGQQQYDGFGTWHYAIQGPNAGSSGLVSSLTFTISGSYSSVAPFDVQNSLGHEFAIDAVFPNCTNEGGCTGFATDGGQNITTPEPGTLTFLAVGLTGLAGLLRRKNRS